MNSVSVWRWIAGVLFGLVVGIMGGQFTPNRNLVTNDTLERQLQPLTVATQAATAQGAATQVQVNALQSEVSTLKGELQGAKLIQVEP